MICRQKINNMMVSVFERVETKVENAGFLHIFPFPQCFQNGSSSRSMKNRIVGKLLYLKLIRTSLNHGHIPSDAHCHFIANANVQ